MTDISEPLSINEPIENNEIWKLDCFPLERLSLFFYK